MKASAALKIKTLSLILCLAAIMAFVSGCSDRGEKDGEEPRPSKAVTELSCVSPSAQPTLLAAADGRLLVCWADYGAEQTALRLVDVAGDRLCQSLDLKGLLEPIAEGFSDGGFALRDRQNSRWLFLSSELEELSEFKTEYMDGVFSHDRSCYYYLKDRSLCCADTAGGGSVPLSLPLDLRFSEIAAIHPTKDSIALHALSSAFGTDCGTAILDLDSGSFSMLDKGLYQTSFGKSYVQLLRFDNDSMQYAVTYCRKEDAKKLSADFFGGSGELVPLGGSDYLIGVGDCSRLYRLSESVETCSLKENGLQGEFRSACWIPSGGLIVGSVWRDSGGVLYALCPELLSFTETDAAQPAETPMRVDESISERYWGELSGGKLPMDMQGLRSLADKIEQKYGVRIFLSENCRDMASFCDFELVLTDSMERDAELRGIGAYLAALENSLAMFPKGFFGQLESGSEDGRLCFLPVEKIKSDTQVIGICYQNAEHCVIALDIGIDDMIASLCHEIWHAAEYKILTEDYSAFKEESWQRLNPKDFSYSENRDTAGEDQNRWTLVDGAGEIFFIDAYARTNSKEDRARLMEYAMARPDSHDRIKSSPALMAKLENMSATLRKFFDSKALIDPIWEKLL